MPEYAKLHLLVIHFPIALLVVGSVLDGWLSWRKRDRSSTTSLFLIGVLGAWLAVITGLLNRNWQVANQLLDTPELQTLTFRHQWLSIAAASVFTIVLVLKVRKRSIVSPAWTHALQGIGLALLIPATHLGGLLAHGGG